MANELTSAIEALSAGIDERSASLGNQPYFASIELTEEERAALETLYRRLYLRVRNVPGRIFIAYDALASSRTERGR